jgi:hypothetical protein
VDAQIEVATVIIKGGDRARERTGGSGHRALRARPRFGHTALSGNLHGQGCAIFGNVHYGSRGRRAVSARSHSVVVFAPVTRPTVTPLGVASVACEVSLLCLRSGAFFSSGTRDALDELGQRSEGSFGRSPL